MVFLMLQFKTQLILCRILKQKDIQVKLFKGVFSTLSKAILAMFDELQIYKIRGLTINMISKTKKQEHTKQGQIRTNQGQTGAKQALIKQRQNQQRQNRDNKGQEGKISRAQSLRTKQGKNHVGTKQGLRGLIMDFFQNDLCMALPVLYLFVPVLSLLSLFYTCCPCFIPDCPCVVPVLSEVTKGIIGLLPNLLVDIVLMTSEGVLPDLIQQLL